MARFTGKRSNFHWFQASDLSLGSLVEAIPALVSNRVIVVSSFDSGPLRLTDDDIAAGWRRTASLAVNPKGLAPHSLPLGEWDEWYVFEEVPFVRLPEVFVNYGAFSLCPDPANEWQQRAVERFWGQIAEWCPESYLAEGDNLICVTRAETAVSELVRFFGVDMQARRTRG